MYAIYGGDPMLVRQRTYCPPCYDYFEERALAEIPNLFKDSGVNADAAVAQLDALLHLSKGAVERELRRDGSRPATVLMFPKELIVDRIPFKRYYMIGTTLEQHTKLARQKMCVDG